MPIIQIGNHQINYEEYGSGHPLLLIAGLGHSRLIWWKQIETLAKRYRVITPDNRDAGDSAPGKGIYGIADMAEDMAEMVRYLALDSIHLIGWSMGGFISLELSLRHPELVDKLILVATSSGGKTHTPPTAEVAAAIFPQANENIEALLSRVNPALAGPGYMQAHPEDLEQMIRYGRKKTMSRKSFQRQYNAISSWSGAVDRLNRITIPAIVIHGTCDPLVPFPNGRRLADQIIGARLLAYSNVGHFPPIEATTQFNRDVMEFLG